MMTRSVWIRLIGLVLALGIFQAAPARSPAQTSTRVYRVGMLAMASRMTFG